MHIFRTCAVAMAVACLFFYGRLTYAGHWGKLAPASKHLPKASATITAGDIAFTIPASYKRTDFSLADTDSLTTRAWTRTDNQSNVLNTIAVLYPHAAHSDSATTLQAERKALDHFMEYAFKQAKPEKPTSETINGVKVEGAEWTAIENGSSEKVIGFYCFAQNGDTVVAFLSWSTGPKPHDALALAAASVRSMRPFERPTDRARP